MNVKTAHDNNLNQNNSINNRRALYEGKSLRNAGRADQLFCSFPADNPSADPDKYEMIQIQHGLPQSGILGHSARVFPVMATDGLRVSLTLDHLERSIVAWTNNKFRVEANRGSGFAIPDNRTTNTGSFTSFTKGYWDNNPDQQADWLGLYGIDGATATGLNKDTAGNGEVVANGTAVAEQQILLCNTSDAECPTNPLDSPALRNVRNAADGDHHFRPFSVGDLLYVATVAGRGDTRRNNWC